jgi:Protein of unknown function, DUF481
VRLLPLLIVAALCGRAGAQIVNAQSALAKAPGDGIGGQTELKLSLNAGNTSLFDAAGAGVVMYRADRFLSLAVVRAEYATGRGLTLTKKTFEHVRERIKLDCRWRWEAFAQHEYDEFRRLSVRALVGTGPAFAIIDSKPFGLLAGAAYMFEYQRLDTRVGTIDAGDRGFDHRASFYITGHEVYSATFIETFYVQPRIDEPSDVRLLGELSIESKLAMRWMLTNGLSVAYDASPPDGVKTYDIALKAGVLVTF